MRGLQFGEQSESPIERAPRADDMRAESKSDLTAHAHVRCTTYVEWLLNGCVFYPSFLLLN